MEAFGRKFERLIVAIDDLVAQETAMIQAADYAAVGEIQRRLEPLIAALTTLGPHIEAPESRDRVRAVLETRQRNIDELGRKVASAKEELNALQRSTRRAARIAPAYGRAEGRGGPNRLRTSG